MRQEQKYDLGLDIGIASVGWCVLGKKRIIDLGVRCFDKAETPDGESLNLARRSARLLRRRLRRRAWRLTKLARLLKREGLIADASLFQQQTPITQSLWQLRVDALDRKLTGEEWARVIYHLCKHRGFWFARKAEADSSEGGKVKQGLERTKALMHEKNYRTAAEMMLAEFPEHQRNKRGDYSQALSRELLGEELATLFTRQRELGNPHASQELETRILDRKEGLFWQQKPALSGEAMLNLMGKCTFEPTEYRAAKRTWSAERFVWLTRLNNLRISIDGESRPLTDAERQATLDLPYKLASVKYKQLKAELVKHGLLPESARFGGLNYRPDKDPEDAKLIELSGYHDLRKALEGKGLKTEWQGLATQPNLLDSIASILTIYKTDEEIHAQLAALDLAAPVIAALETVSFTDFIRLSLKALSKILPGMETGKRYDEACTAAGYHHSQLIENTGSRYLPKLDDDAPNNPVVLRALNQARKVVNAIIREYGPPQQVHIEMARDLSRPLDERYKIEKEQKTYQETRQKAREHFAETFGQAPRAKDFEKWLLYKEQDGKCAYSLQALDLNRLFEDGYTEVDHALPYSRSFDDSKNNKVLVLTSENRDKGNRTPFEYLDGASNSPRWQLFETFVKTNKQYRQAKRDRLLRKNFGKDEAASFKERNLNDTRYICRYFKSFVEHNLVLHPESSYQRCVVLSGQLTSFLRARWGLAKVREASDRHHALDATVVAACSHGMVKRLADYARRKELEEARGRYIDEETGEIIDIAKLRQLEIHFPRPWAHFEDELCLRLGIDRSSGAVLPAETLAAQRDHLQLRHGYSAEEIAAAKPLFVSRAPKRRNGGAAHKDTVYAQPERLKAQGGVTQKVALSSLKLTDLGKLIDPHRNEKLYSASKARLEQFGGKGDKAFPPGYEFRKPDKDGNPTGPIVRTVTALIDKLSGIPLRGGIAKNDSMIRVDVFTKAGKFHLVPVYVHHRVAKALPTRAIVALKDENEWTPIDESFGFCFSLYPNDLVSVSLKGKSIVTGYYAGLDRSTGAISLWAHDRNQAEGKDGLIRGIGVKTALKVEKFHVDVLGRIYPAKPELRRGLA